jgi:outer membrane receptor protein involved in Fe transport
MIANPYLRSRRLRGWALAGCAAAALSPAVALAQQAEPAPEAEAAASDRITVTGSRIARTGMTTPTPVTSMSAAELENLGPTTIMESLEALPQFINSDSPNNALGTSGAAGQSLLNLRGVGSNRTLTLLDGRRIVPSTRRGTTDVSILPQNLIERVEVVTGGASAAYGSDAVAGVVNFMLDTDYVGLKGEIQGGISEQGDAENVTLSGPRSASAAICWCPANTTATKGWRITGTGTGSKAGASS